MRKYSAITATQTFLNTFGNQQNAPEDPEYAGFEARSPAQHRNGCGEVQMGCRALLAGNLKLRFAG
jgi:hypothetical protein